VKGSGFDKGNHVTNQNNGRSSPDHLSGGRFRVLEGGSVAILSKDRGVSNLYFASIVHAEIGVLWV